MDMTGARIGGETYRFHNAFGHRDLTLWKRCKTSNVMELVWIGTRSLCLVMVEINWIG